MNLKMKSIRENLLKLLKGSMPEGLPWFSDLTYWHFAMAQKHELEKKYLGFAGLLNLHRDLETGFYLQGYEPYIPRYKNCEVYEVERQIGSEDFASLYHGSKIIKSEKDNNNIIRKIVTKKGKIDEEWQYSLQTFSWAPTKYLINSIEDLKVFKYWVENTSYVPDYERAYMVKELVGDIGCVLCYQPRSPFMQLIVLFSGISNVVNLMMEDGKLFAETIEVLKSKSDEAAEIVLRSPAEFIMIPENLSSEMVGKKFYEEYLRQYETEWCSKIKSNGKYSFIHMDGSLKGLLKEVSSAGFSVIEAMTPAPVGDLEVSEFDNYIRGDTVMWGGLPGALFIPSFDDEKFEEFVVQVIKIMVLNPRYVLGIGDQLPPDGIIERVKVVSELVNKYGVYSR